MGTDTVPLAPFLPRGSPLSLLQQSSPLQQSVVSPPVAMCKPVETLLGAPLQTSDLASLPTAGMSKESRTEETQIFFKALEAQEHPRAAEFHMQLEELRAEPQRWSRGPTGVTRGPW